MFSDWGGVALAIAVVVVGVLFYLSAARIREEPAIEMDLAQAGAQQTPAQQPPQFAAMQLQGQFAGPLAGTIIQRWRDPVDGTTCYLYLPVVVAHKPAPSGYVQYGSNSIGSISCLPPSTAPATRARGGTIGP